MFLCCSKSEASAAMPLTALPTLLISELRVANIASVSLILAHNHPSGNLKPSTLDIELTRCIKEAAKLMRINVLDHIIMTSESYYSFSDEGTL